MRSVLTQGHADNVRDFILNCKLDRADARLIDFTFGKGGLWETEYPYKCQLTKCDAVPTAADVIKKELGKDGYGDLGWFDGGFFDPPYLRGREGSDNSTKQENGKNKVIPASQQGENSWAAEGQLARFMSNESDQVFIDRVKALNNVALQCLKKGAYLFVKVQDTRQDGILISNQKLCIDHLTNFAYVWCAPYVKAGGQTWKHQFETSHGFWLTFRMLKDGRQTSL